MASTSRTDCDTPTILDASPIPREIEAEIRMIASTMTPAEAQAFVAKFANGAALAAGSLDH